MNLITIASLVACGLTPTVARKWAEPLRAACERYEQTTPERFGCALAQWRVETNDFADLEENLHYTTARRLLEVFPATLAGDKDLAERLIAGGPRAIANYVYGKKNGNRGRDTDDGWRYRGRGPTHTTGRAKYLQAEQATGIPFVENPDLMMEPDGAAMAAAQDFQRLNEFADVLNFDSCTRGVNGRGMQKRIERAALSGHHIQALRRLAQAAPA